jgi:hypothetical protein
MKGCKDSLRLLCHLQLFIVPLVFPATAEMLLFFFTAVTWAPWGLAQEIKPLNTGIFLAKIVRGLYICPKRVFRQ